ncbi:hypothetical protein GCM10009716_33880 [Streptomyces sodiiphilus]|uniref:Putative restriction endonuclease domain-containing protein n=1 Tax=Streptomyces sodiiphilus TaxID=226217 RepID=A0ABN2PK39_9ACTN
MEVLEAVNVVIPDGLLIPDIVVADAAAAADAELTLDPHGILAVIEIASPSTRVTDRKMKPILYAAAGIADYWRVELEPVPRLYAGELLHGGYRDTVVAQAGAPVRLARPFPVEIDPGALVARG